MNIKCKTYLAIAALTSFMSIGLSASAQTIAGPSYACETSTAQYEDPAQYVSCNANIVLSALNDSDTNESERITKFEGYMDQFADINRVGKFTLGSRYTRKISQEDMGRFITAFRENMLAVYRDELDEMRGDKIQVVKTLEKREGREAIVNTYVLKQGEVVTEVDWRIMNFGKGWQVVDVAINFDGQLIWLAIEQRQFHQAILERNNGAIDGLINTINQSTAEITQRIATRQG